MSEEFNPAPKKPFLIAILINDKHLLYQVNPLLIRVLFHAYVSTKKKPHPRLTHSLHTVCVVHKTTHSTDIKYFKTIPSGFVENCVYKYFLIIIYLI